MGTMKYSRWKGAHGGVSHYYNRTAMVEQVQPASRGSSGSAAASPITLVDRQMMAYVHHTRERHFQLRTAYQQKSNATECKLREGELLRRRWHRKLQKSFIAFMQFKTMKVLEEQAQLVHQYGQASVNAALGDPGQGMLRSPSGGKKSEVNSGEEAGAEVKRAFASLHRKVQALPSVAVVPKHVATMKQIHNDRFNFRWRVN